ncbi:hypothetical protein QU42_19395 [Bradyrhizobium sp. UASWS1016]|jgi:hypothetical protein|nr:hypothetical protein QU42_19395 [Bradyrhizobium sp. UASWS1016]
MAMTNRKSPPLKLDQRRSLAEAVRATELAGTEAWDDLDILSSNTHVEAIEVFEDEIRFDGNRIEGPINVHVTLQYSEDVVLSESFPGRFEASWENGKPSIKRIVVDTSSFTG